MDSHQSDAPRTPHQEAAKIAAAAVVDLDGVWPDLRRAAAQVLDNLAAAGYDLSDAVSTAELVNRAADAMLQVVVAPLMERSRHA